MNKLLGLTRFFPEKAPGVKTLVICNYKWYRSYYWHIPQLDNNLADGTVTVVNFAELGVPGGTQISIFKKMSLLKGLITETDRVIVDGFPGYGVFLLIILGAFKTKRLILATQNYIALSLSFRSISKFMFLKLAFGRADLIFCCSHGSRRLFWSYFGANVARKCKVFYSPINFESLPDFLPPSTTVGSYVLSAGQANRDYHLLSLALKDFHGPVTINCPRGVYEEIEFSHNVSYQKNLPTSELLSLISNCRFLVIPLQDTIEPSGLRILYFGLELGKAIIVSETEPLKEIFSDTPPFIFYPCGCSSSLSEIIQDLNKDEEKIRLMGAHAREWAENNLLSSDRVNEIWRTEVLTLH